MNLRGTKRHSVGEINHMAAIEGATAEDWRPLAALMI